MDPASDPFDDRARTILRASPLIDGHNDLAYALRGKVGLRTSSVDLRASQPDLDTDIPRLRAGGVGGQFWSVWVPAALPEPEAVHQALEQMDVVHRFIGTPRRSPWPRRPTSWRRPLRTVGSRRCWGSKAAA